VLDIGALGAVGVNGELDVPALIRVRLDVRERLGQVVRCGRVETRFRAPSTVVVLADVDLVRKKLNPRTGRRMGIKDHVGEQVTFVVAVEVDLKDAADVRLIVGVVVER
jgi:hypothetical protein